jgi:hypothetical protein
MHDVIGCYLDLDSGEIKFSKNGVDLGKAFTIPQQMKSSAFFSSVVLKVSETILFFMNPFLNLHIASNMFWKKN